MNNLSQKLSSIWDKLKKIKHIEIYIALFFAFIVMLIYFASFKGGGDKDNSTNLDTLDKNFSTSSEYIGYLENKLENVLGQVKGAGNVDIIITIDKGFEYVYATEEEVKTNSNGSTITTSTVILIDGKPVIEKELFPSIKGVVVVSQGANDVSVRMNLLTAIQTVISVDNSRITILAGN